MDDIPEWLSEAIEKMHHEEYMNFAHLWHQGMWGVPCGPTLTMVNPTVMKGIVVRMEPPFQFAKPWTKEQLAKIIRLSKEE